MNQKNKIFQFTFFLLAVLSAPLVAQEAVQEVYEYKNKKGVTEFTDQVDPNKKLEKHIEIPKRTADQEAQSQAKLNTIVENDKKLDARVADRKQVEATARHNNNSGNNQNQYNYDGNSDRRDFDDNNYDGYLPVGAVRPIRPIDRPIDRPVEGIHRPHGGEHIGSGKPRIKARVGGRL